MSKLIFVIPTYNESSNLPTLVEKIAALNLENWSMIVVDDNSPDGTGQLAEKLAEKYPIKVLHRTAKTGLGDAYREGFELALSMHPEYILHMDADLSHDPQYIPDMLRTIPDYDLVIGSRYVKGGATKNWPWTRLMISKYANMFAHLALRSKIHDLTSGFKVFKYHALKHVAHKGTSSIGYSFLSEVSLMCEEEGFKIKEVPIVFIERAEGVSKFNFKIVLESAFRVLKLSFKRVTKK